MILRTMIGRVDFFASHSAQDCSYEAATAGIACMHVKSYDTETVPQDKQHSAESDKSILHINLQIYKIFRTRASIWDKKYRFLKKLNIFSLI